MELLTNQVTTMAVASTLINTIFLLPSSFLLLIAPFLLASVILTAVRIYTTSRYRRSLSYLDEAAPGSKNANPPPPVPYTIPFLGHAIAFLAPRPGQFWAKLFRSHPRVTGACTLLLGGNRTHILFSPVAVQALFKTRNPSRDGFNLQIAELALGIEHKQATRYFGIGEGPDHTGVTPVQQQERINHNFLMEKNSVNELTAEFTRVLRNQLAGEMKSEDGNKSEKEVALYAWLVDRMFQASTTAFMGSRLIEMYPNLREDFFAFDRYMLTMFFRIPKLLAPTAYNVRERALAGLIKWQQQMQEECNREPSDPDGDVDWEPVYGSRANRARQRYYASRGLNMRTRAAMDLGFLFGASSNAIPAAGWMLMHILNPKGDKTLPRRVLEEIETAEREDGSLDIPTLVALPLLQSIFNEVLRLYVDVLVTRELKEDLTLPLDEGERRVQLEKDSIVLAPSWLGHRDESLWVDPPCSQFYAERFLKAEPDTGKQTFTTRGTEGKFFPFGGGKTICPGRIFAKQEVLASVAVVLLSFEIIPQRFVDEKGKTSTTFPEFRESFSGSGIMATDADMMIKIKGRRTSRA